MVLSESDTLSVEDGCQKLDPHTTPRSVTGEYQQKEMGMLNKQISLLIRRKYWLVLLVLCLIGFMSLNMPSNGSRRRSVEQMYAQLNQDNLPFRIVKFDQEPKKEPVKHVAFLKVHKTGSTSAQNMFLRFVWKNDLTLVLPPNKNKFGYPNIISLLEGPTVNNTLPPPRGKHYEVLCNHVIYDRKSFHSMMPEDSFYIGIIREPFEMFKSALNYIRPGYIFNKIKTGMPASTYLLDPEKYEPTSIKHSMTNSRMAIEFGCNDETIRTKKPELIVDFIKQVDKDFGLVIIAEHFEESIVLMRRYLNWSTKDIVYADKNIALKKNETALVGPYDRQLFKRFAKVDYALYEHFYRRLRDQIRAEGFDFDDELLHFKEVRKMVNEFCRQKKIETDTKLVVEKSKWSDAFEITTTDCELIKKPEMKFVQAIREKQYGTRDI